MKCFLTGALVVIAAFTIAGSARAQNCEEKVTICHVAGKGRTQTLSVSKCAVQSHLANHGDFLGACETICTLGASCDDGNACTSDVCNASTGACEHPPVVCNDGNACTVESCNPQTGCVSAPVTCDDQNACTSDSCSPATGCVNAPLSCDDGNACSVDSCNPQTGCTHTSATCDDQNACTVDSCSPVSGCEFSPVACDDGNACTIDTCDVQNGCAHTPVTCAPGQTCNPGTGTCQPVATAEVCGDAIDNDLDGGVDEGCIGDRSWRDVNVNGLQDPGEPGLAGATFFLRTATGALVQVAVSNANGNYYFSNVPPGQYFIEVVVPIGFGVTSANVGSNDAVDSDFDGESLTTDVFTFSGAADYSWDAGFVPPPPES